MALNKGQQSAVDYIANWWQCNSSYLVLDSKGGTGKTYLIDYVLPLLAKCDPILLTPTNESLKQLRDKLVDPSKWEIKTIHSALGITPTTSKKDIVFKVNKNKQLPAIWDRVNLAVIDEASMISEEILDILIGIGVKILWVGHSSQLPPIVINRKRSDTCISPVFSQGWETITLTQPMRNTGKLWEFNNKVEKMIYDPKLPLPNTYDIKKKELLSYLNSDEGKQHLLEGKTKVVAWSNAGVDRLNSYLRNIIFGVDKAKSKYVPNDTIILIKPYNLVENLDRYKESGLFKLVNDKKIVTSFYSNTKATVINCKEVVVTLNKELSIPCYKIKVLCEDESHYIYEAKNKDNITEIADYYAHLAWQSKDPSKIYTRRNFILSCFADIKHYFSATSHRLQGASVPNIIVIWNNILKNPNRVERSKCAYVSTSRTINELMIYRGSL